MSRATHVRNFSNTGGLSAPPAVSSTVPNFVPSTNPDGVGGSCTAREENPGAGAGCEPADGLAFPLRLAFGIAIDGNSQGLAVGLPSVILSQRLCGLKVRASRKR